MPPLQRAAKIAAWTAAGGVYVWFAAVRNADAVRARKADRRRRKALDRRPT